MSNELIDARMMIEWENQKQQQQEELLLNVNNNNNGMFDKVMTDEQMEVLRKQIAVYAAICEQLKMQKSLTGVMFGNLYCDPLATSSGNKITGRQRWSPTVTQLEILEKIYQKGAPSKQEIKNITIHLSQYGSIFEPNVYNWFQNRRARSKRKQHLAESSNSKSGDKKKAPMPNAFDVPTNHVQKNIT